MVRSRSVTLPRPGILFKEDEVPRRAREFTNAQVQAARTMQKRGEPRGEIARMLGVSSATYAWYLQVGRFGMDLPTARGRGRKLKRPDDESKEIVFGCPSKEWKSRQDKIRESWPEDEREKRARGKVPGFSDNYARFKNNPYRNNQPGRNPNK